MTVGSKGTEPYDGSGRQHVTVRLSIRALRDSLVSEVSRNPS